MHVLTNPGRYLLALTLLLTVAVSLGGCTPFRARLMDENRVIELLYKNQPEKALMAAQEVVVNAPEDYRSYLIRSYVYRVLNNPEAAKADIEKARQIFAQSPIVSPEDRAQGFDKILAGMPRNMPLTLYNSPWPLE